MFLYSLISLLLEKLVQLFGCITTITDAIYYDWSIINSNLYYNRYIHRYLLSNTGFRRNYKA